MRMACTEWMSNMFNAIAWHQENCSCRIDKGNNLQASAFSLNEKSIRNICLAFHLIGIRWLRNRIGIVFDRINKQHSKCITASGLSLGITSKTLPGKHVSKLCLPENGGNYSIPDLVVFPVADYAIAMGDKRLWFCAQLTECHKTKEFCSICSICQQCQ